MFLVAAVIAVCPARTGHRAPSGDQLGAGVDVPAGVGVAGAGVGVPADDGATVAGAGLVEAPGVGAVAPGVAIGDVPGLLDGAPELPELPGPGVTEAAGVPAGEALGTVVKIGVIAGVGVGLGAVMLPWPNMIADRNTSPNTTATPTTHHFETGSSTYGSVSPPGIAAVAGGRPLPPLLSGPGRGPTPPGRAAGVAAAAFDPVGGDARPARARAGAGPSSAILCSGPSSISRSSTDSPFPMPGSTGGRTPGVGAAELGVRPAPPRGICVR